MEKLKAFSKSYGTTILIVLHSLGLIALIIWDFKVYAAYTPLNLLLSTAILVLAQEKVQTRRFATFFLIVFSLGYLVELLGTMTGFPFGEYHYGSNLSPLLLGVPVVIGLNWFLLTMSAAYLAARIFTGRWLRLVIGALLMVLLDVFIEQVAPLLEYWQWSSDIVPLENYFSWFLVGLVMQALHIRFLEGSNNRVAAPYYFIVFAFFVILNLSL